MGDEHPDAADYMMPDLGEKESSNNDKTYKDEELEDIELSYKESVDGGSDNEDKYMKETRSG